MICDKILIANGVNLDLLGTREPEIYGRKTLDDLETEILSHQAFLTDYFFKQPFEIVFFQTNSEEKYLEMLDREWDGAILNPGAWTHTSLALGDRLAALKLCFVEVHISKLAARELPRQNSYIARHALGSISGFGLDSYLAALLVLGKHIRSS